MKSMKHCLQAPVSIIKQEKKINKRNKELTKLKIKKKVMLSLSTDDILCPWKILRAANFQNLGVRSVTDHVPREAFIQLVKIINTKSFKWNIANKEIFTQENQLNLRRMKIGGTQTTIHSYLFPSALNTYIFASLL